MASLGFIHNRRPKFSFDLWSFFLVWNASAAEFDSDAETGIEFIGIRELTSGRNLHMAETRHRDQWYAEVLLLIPGRNAAYSKYSSPLEKALVFRLYAHFGFVFPHCEFSALKGSVLSEGWLCFVPAMLTEWYYHSENLTLSPKDIQQILSTWMPLGCIK